MLLIFINPCSQLNQLKWHIIKLYYQINISILPKSQRQLREIYKLIIIQKIDQSKQNKEQRMQTTFSKKFIQQQQIEQKLSTKYGYTVSPTSLASSKISLISPQKSLQINKNIQPRVIEQVQIVASPQHRLLMKEMAEIEHEKSMRRKFQEKGEGQQFNVIKMLNERIKQYNYLIDHKHIIQKNSEDTKKVLKLKPKSEAELIIEEINKKNVELTKAQDIQKQFQINKSIGALYRKYKQKMFEDRVERNRQFDKLNKTITPQSIKIRNIRNTSLASNNNENRNRLKSQHYSQIKVFALANSRTQDMKNKDCSQDPEEINLQEPFISKQDIKKTNEIQRRQQINKEIMEMYKFKITTYSNMKQNLRKQRALKKLSKSRMKKSTLEIKQKQQKGQKIHMNPFYGAINRQKQQIASQILISEIRNKKRMQQKYFSSYLEKRNRKFKKPWGNKILIKYDSNSQAKMMLQSSPKIYSPNKTQNFSNSGATLKESFSKNQLSPKTTSFRFMPKSQVSEDDKMIIESMKQEQNDRNHYETMCKNQKINLFLKAKKRNKQ